MKRSVRVKMVHVREMGVSVEHRLVAMKMRMPRSRRHFGCVGMEVVHVVDMLVIVFDRFMEMFVLVVFGQVKPDTEKHQGACHDERNAHRFAHEKRKQDAEKWGG